MLPAVLLALAFGQLVQPQEQACMWGSVQVFCQQGCSCAEVERRLELARADIERNWGDCPDFDAAVKGWRIFVTSKRHIPGPAGEILYGVTVPEERRLVLSWDMRAALHELVHVLEVAKGTALRRKDLFDHPLWATNSAIREIDDRYKLRYRSRPP